MVVDCQSIRLAALCWNGEGSFLFTSSSAPYDCNDNGSCDEVCLNHSFATFSFFLSCLFWVFLGLNLLILGSYLHSDKAFLYRSTC